MKKGDVFHDGVLGYWILDSKPKGKKLYIYPVDSIFKKGIQHSCGVSYHDPKTWDLTGLKVVCNRYDNPGHFKSLNGDGNSLSEKLLAEFDIKNINK